MALSTNSSSSSWFSSRLHDAGEGIKDIKEGLAKQKAEREAKRAKNAEEMANPELLTTTDEIETSYNYRKNTQFYKDIVDRLGAYSVVSSPSATNSLANWSIWAAIPAKVLSFILTHLVLVYLLGQSSLGKSWFTVDEIKVISTLFVFATSVFVEFYSSKAMKELFNSTSSWVTRIIMFGVGVAVSWGIYNSHILYNSTYTQNATTANISAVASVSSPEITRINREMELNNNAILTEKQMLSRKDKAKQIKIEEIEARAKPHLDKARMYAGLVKKANENGKKLIIVNGKKKTVASVNLWASAQQKIADKILQEKQLLGTAFSHKISALESANQQLARDLKAEQDRLLLIMNKTTNQSSHGGLMIQIIISLLAKIDLLGYFILRLNIKNHVLNSMGKILESFRELDQLSRISETFQAQIAQLYVQIETQGRGNTLRMENAHKGTVLLANRGLETSHQLLSAITNKNFKEADDILEANIEDNNEVIRKMNKKNHANYTPTGDLDIDTQKPQQDVDEIDKDLQLWLQGEVNRAGYPLTVQLLPNFPDGRIDGNIITIGTGYSQEDSYRLLIHELAHYESGSDGHGDEFIEGKNRVIEKLSFKNNPKQSKAKKSKDVTISNISQNRGLDILTAFFIEEHIQLSDEEFNYLSQRGAIKDGKIFFKDETHAVNILQLG